MKIGILADIHENLSQLHWALDLLRAQGTDHLVVLGDVFDTGRDLRETCDVLADAGAIGVWGNHDFGLCHGNAEPADRVKYGPRVIDFMGSLLPRLELGGCLFTHVEPWLDPTQIAELWYIDGPPQNAEQASRIFTAVPHRLMFVGHYHQWLLITPDGPQPWSGKNPIIMNGPGRYLVSVHAVADGRCALIDTESNTLIPFERVGGDSLRKESREDLQPG